MGADTTMVPETGFDYNTYAVDMKGGKMTMLGAAIQSGKTEMVRMLLAVPAVNVNKGVFTEAGSTPLGAAVGTGNLEIVSLLLARPELNLNTIPMNGMSAFCFALDHGHRDVARLLLDDPRLAPNACGDNPMPTPLMCACEHGYVKIVRKLLAADGGKEAAALVHNGESAASAAVKSGSTECLRLVLAALASTCQ
jgi:ankyrin repeat protein